MTRVLKGNGDNTSRLTLAIVGNLALADRTNLVLEVVLKKKKKKVLVKRVPKVEKKKLKDTGYERWRLNPSYILLQPDRTTTLETRRYLHNPHRHRFSSS